MDVTPPSTPLGVMTRRPLTRLIRPVLGLLLMSAIFGWMGYKIARHWAEVRDRIGTISVGRFAVAAVLFAIFLFAFRAVVWRRILDRLGCPVPLAPAIRVWSSSELARYIPGGIWQVAGRVYLIRPYGVGKTVCAASQILELIVFLLANILVGVGCLAAFGVRHVHGQARVWLFALAAAVPLLALLLHPSVSYGLLNAFLRRTGKPPLDVRLTGRELARLLAWNVLGLFWQSLAIFLIVSGPLGLHWDKWYVVTGAYSLAWCAGFLVVISPGGIGVREPVFAAVMVLALPASVDRQFASSGTLLGFLTFLSIVLRLWTIAGEILLSGVAHLADPGGALGRVRPKDEAGLAAAAVPET